MSVASRGAGATACETDGQQLAGRPRSATPLLLGLAAILGAAAVADKFFGWLGNPLLLVVAAVAPVYLALGLSWTRLRRRAGSRLTPFSAFVVLNLLTGASLLALRTSADPTPVMLQTQLDGAARLLEAGEIEEAHLRYQSLRKDHPRSFPVLMGLGASAYQMGDYSRSRRYFAEALPLAPSNSRWRVLNDLGQAHWKLGEPEEALELYERARTAGMPESELLEWHYRMGWAAFDAGRLDQSIIHYQWVADRRGKYAAASLYNMGCAYAQKIAELKKARSGSALAEQAVARLREAWNLAATGSEREALRDGLIGAPDARDPELEPLRRFPVYREFLRQVRSEVG